MQLVCVIMAKHAKAVYGKCLLLQFGVDGQAESCAVHRRGNSICKQVPLQHQPHASVHGKVRQSLHQQAYLDSGTSRNERLEESCAKRLLPWAAASHQTCFEAKVTDTSWTAGRTMHLQLLQIRVDKVLPYHSTTYGKDTHTTKPM